MRPARTVRSSTSCPASTRRGARSIVQGAVRRRPGSRLPVALREVPAGTRADRHLQPQLLRGNAGCPRASGDTRAPASAAGARAESIWKQRYREIRNFEEYLTGNGITIRKFFLHVSRGEQRRRFLERIDDPAKNWKFSAGDALERRHWREYMPPTRTPFAPPRRPTRHGMWSRPTTNGSPGWWSRRRSSTHSTRSSWSILASLSHSANSWPRLGPSSGDGDVRDRAPLQGAARAD